MQLVYTGSKKTIYLALIIMVFSILNMVAQSSTITTTPTFSVTTLEGKTYTSENTKGYVVVLNFWRTTCKPCIKELPELNALAKKYKRKKVIFLGVAYNTKTQLKKFLRKNTFNYNIVSQEVAGKFLETHHRRSTEGFKMLPTQVVIDQQGVFILDEQKNGTKIITKIDNIIAQLLKRNKP